MKKHIVFFCLVILSFSAYSQESTINQLTKRIEQLENRVTILEKNIADSNNKEIQKENVVATDKQKWRKLNKGMYQDEVRKLLGEPLSVESNVFTHWYYSNSTLQSYVIFDDNNRVYGWKEPE